MLGVHARANHSYAAAAAPFSEAGREGVAGEASEADGEVHVDAGGEDSVVAIHVVDWRQAGNWSTPGDFNPDLKYPSFQLNVSNGLFVKGPGEQGKCGGAQFQNPPSNAYMRLVVAFFTPVLLPRSGRLWALFSDSFFQICKKLTRWRFWCSFT